MFSFFVVVCFFLVRAEEEVGVWGAGRSEGARISGVEACDVQLMETNSQ